jgi:hypothetical protein
MAAFECYTYFEYCHVSATLTLNTAICATLTFNTTIWVLHLLHSNGIIDSKCSTEMAALKVSVTLKWQY